MISRFMIQGVSMPINMDEKLSDVVLEIYFECIEAMLKT